MKSIHKTYTIEATPHEIWRSLTVPDEIEKWGAGPAKMDDQEGTEFSLWGGEIWGKNTKVEDDKLLEQEWYGGKWDAPSLLTITLTADDGTTTVDLNQTNVPDNEVADVDEGWDDYYFGEIKKYLEDK